LTNLYILKI